MTDARIAEHVVGDDCWLLDPTESGERRRWLRSDTFVDRAEWA